MTSGPMIDYEALAQDAMRGLVRTVLSQAAKSGLPGDHHFYISFDTQATGVIMSKRLKEKYPSEMTIVLQHRFWDLLVTDERFEVKLTFDGIPERLVIPFKAVKVFFDPSVRYGLQFEEPELPTTGESPSDMRAPMTTRSSSPRKPRTPRKPKQERELNAVQPTPHTHDPAPATPIKHTARPSPAPTQQPVEKVPTAASSDVSVADDNQERQAPAAKPAAVSAEIVSLDAFRKK